ncbi:MAG: AAA family ATPase [Thermoprotei archaeon]|nr:AAA family ATPase [Thermoprotei archaeon]
MKVISVTSGAKGGTGKTTVLLNTAVFHAILSQEKFRRYVLLVDAEANTGTATMLISRELYLKLRKAEEKSLMDYLLNENIDVEDVLYVIEFKDLGYAMFLAPFVAPIEITSKITRLSVKEIYSKMILFIDEVTNKVALDAIYIDLPALTFPHDLALAMFLLSDLIIPVGTPDPACLLSLYSTITIIKDYIEPPPQIAPLVLNKISATNAVEPTTRLHYKALYRKLLGVPVYEIHEDENITNARSAGMIEILAKSLKYNDTVRTLIKYAQKIVSHPIEHRERKLLSFEKVDAMLKSHAERAEEAETLLLTLLRSRGRKPL